MGAEACPVCGAPGADSYRSRNAFEIGRCGACGHQWTMLRSQELPGQDEYPPFEQSDGFVARVRRRVFGVFLHDRVRLTRWAKSSGRLLDFGCGSGAFAEAAQRAGYDATGIEKFSLRRERTDGPVLIKGDLERLDGLADFDIVTAWHVIEHMNEPAEVLRQLSEHLAPDGRLLVCVPNVGGWQARIFRGGWFHLDPPRHLHHFTRDSLTRTLEQAGLRPVGWRWWTPEYGISGWVQSILNRFDSTHNVLYEAVKDRSELDAMSPRKRRLAVAASLVAAAPLAALSLPAEALSAARESSASLTVTAALD